MVSWGRVAGTAVLFSFVAVCAAGAADFDPKAATEAYLATVTGEARAKSDAYFEGGYWITLYDALISMGVALALLFTRMSAGLRSVAESVTGWRWLQTFLYVAMFIVVTSAISFPWTHYVSFTREHEFNLSNQSFDEWLNEYFIGAAVGVVLSGLFITIIYAIVRRAPQSWWLFATGASAAFIVFVLMIGPVFISPLFNEYKPMREGPLKQEILAMARANGVPVTDVFEVDASKQTKRISANVQGLGATARVSLNDNLLERGTPAEVKAVMGHEIGHYALGHSVEMIVTLTVLAAVAFLFVQGGFAVLHGMFGSLWGVRDIADPAGLPIAMFLFSLFGLLATPIQNTIIRANEAEADIYGLNAAREPDGFATIALKLAEYRKLDPTPWEEFVFYDHPSGRSRVSMAMKWKAENLPKEAPQTLEPVVPNAPGPDVKPVP